MTASVSSQTIHQMSFDQLQKKLLEIKSDVIFVNFWATWCKPCIEELPTFEALNKKYSSEKVKVILVNVDFNSNLTTDVAAFVKNKNLQSETWHITDTDPNTWINKVDSSWSGAIPATIVYDSSHKKILFIERTIALEALEGIIARNLKK